MKDLQIRMIDELQNREYIFFVQNNSVLLKKDGCSFVVPQKKDFVLKKITGCSIHFLGVLNGCLYNCAEFSNNVLIDLQFELVDLRQLSSLIEFSLWRLAGLARQIIDWDRNFTFCGSCGTKTRYLQKERAKECLQCGLVNYPRISPAMIVAVVKEKTILLARAKRFKFPFYSLLSGFVEPGESVEETVHREIFEEVGIKVKKLSYFGSQSWPFPDCLMLGFFAEYKEGELRIDKDEILDAKWFSVDQLPDTPKSISIAKKMIDSFIYDQK